MRINIGFIFCSYFLQQPHKDKTCLKQHLICSSNQTRTTWQRTSHNFHYKSSSEFQPGSWVLKTTAHDDVDDEDDGQRSGWRLRLERPPLTSPIHIWRAYYYCWTDSPVFCQEHDFRTVRLLNQNIYAVWIRMYAGWDVWWWERAGQRRRRTIRWGRDGCGLECCKEFLGFKLEK